jgi:subtilisin family serine protease
MMVVAAGNSGPSCSTVSDPPALYDAVYTVGALNTNTDTIASFSSRGPVTSDGSMRLKPDITAPGTSTRSAYNTSDTTYVFLSGTSMATPHIAGAVALLWSAHPELQNDPEASEVVINNSAFHILSNTCDGGSATTPNNTFGNGRVDILAAVDSVMVDTVTISKAQYSNSRSQLTVLATDSNTAAVLTVSVTSTGEILGVMQTRGDGNYRLKVNGVANPLNVTVTSNLGGTDSANVRAR